jgi:hypothetical protein
LFGTYAALLALISPWALQAETEAQNDAAEPPQEFYVEIGNQQIPIAPDRPLKLPASGETTITLRLKPYRTFSRSGVEFQYPREFLFEADVEDPNNVLWTLEGKDTVLMIFRAPRELDPQGFLEELQRTMTEQYGEPNVRTSNTSIKLKEETLDGTRLDIRLAGSRLYQDLYALRGRDFTYALILQQSPDDLGRPTSESRHALRKFRETFRLAEAPGDRR